MKIDRENIKKVAEELGLELVFDSNTPGVLNTSTDEHTSFNEFLKVFLDESEIISDENDC